MASYSDMAFYSDDDTAMVFDLGESGEGGFFRVPMKNKGPEDYNRYLMINDGQKFQVLAHLLDVVHGKLRDGQGDATLLIALFSFLPTAQRRFKDIRVRWKFESDDPAIGIEVQGIAPELSWSLSPSKRVDASSLALNANIASGPGPVTAGGGGTYTMTSTQEKDFHTTVTGSMRLFGRDGDPTDTPQSGMPNTAMWYLEENPDGQKRGIARMLRVGVLLKRTALPGKTAKKDTFRGSIWIDAHKDYWSQKASEVKRITKNPTVNEAVIFRPGHDTSSHMFEIDKDNLADALLKEEIMYMSLYENFDDMVNEKKERKKKAEEEKQREEELKKKEEEGRQKEEEKKKRREEREKGVEERRKEAEEQMRRKDERRWEVEEARRRRDEANRFQLYVVILLLSCLVLYLAMKK